MEVAKTLCTSAEGTWRIPETKEGLGSSRDTVGRRTKIRLFKTLARPFLLYGCESWKITKNDERNLNSFQCQCLRLILRIRWQQRRTNERVVELAEVTDIALRYEEEERTG